MKTLLISALVAGFWIVAGSSAFAIDHILHDVVDHTIGQGHHHDYYAYDYGYNGYAAYPGYYGYGRPHYSHTHAIWSGGHHSHHSIGLGHFGLGHGGGHGHGHGGGHGHGHGH